MKFNYFFTIKRPIKIKLLTNQGFIFVKVAELVCVFIKIGSERKNETTERANKHKETNLLHCINFSHESYTTNRG